MIALYILSYAVHVNVANRYPDRYTTTTTTTTPEPVGGGNNGGDADGSIENGLFAALGLPEWWWAPAAGFLLLMLVVWMGWVSCCRGEPRLKMLQPGSEEYESAKDIFLEDYRYQQSQRPTSVRRGAGSARAPRAGVGPGPASPAGPEGGPRSPSEESAEVPVPAVARTVSNTLYVQDRGGITSTSL